MYRPMQHEEHLNFFATECISNVKATRPSCAQINLKIISSGQVPIHKFNLEV